MISITSILIITNPTYTKICKIPATGRITILDWPRATLTIFFQRNAGLSLLSTSFPNLILRIISFKLLTNNNEEAMKIIKNMMFSTSII